MPLDVLAASALAPHGAAAQLEKNPRSCKQRMIYSRKLRSEIFLEFGGGGGVAGFFSVFLIIFLKIVIIIIPMHGPPHKAGEF